MFSFGQKVEWLWVTRWWGIWELNWNVRQAWVSGALSVPSCGSVLLIGKGSAALQLSSAVHFYSDEQQAQHSMLCLFKVTVGALWRLCKIPFNYLLHHLCHCEIPKLISVVILRKMQHRSQGSWKGQAASQHDCWAWNWQHWGVFSASVVTHNQVD